MWPDKQEFSVSIEFQPNYAILGLRESGLPNASNFPKRRRRYDATFLHRPLLLSIPVHVKYNGHA